MSDRPKKKRIVRYPRVYNRYLRRTKRQKRKSANANKGNESQVEIEMVKTWPMAVAEKKTPPTSTHIRLPISVMMHLRQSLPRSPRPATKSVPEWRGGNMPPFIRNTPPSSQPASANQAFEVCMARVVVGGGGLCQQSPGSGGKEKSQKWMQIRTPDFVLQQPGAAVTRSSPPPPPSMHIRTLDYIRQTMRATKSSPPPAMHFRNIDIRTNISSPQSHLQMTAPPPPQPPPPTAMNIRSTSYRARWAIGRSQPEPIEKMFHKPNDPDWWSSSLPVKFASVSDDSSCDQDSGNSDETEVEVPEEWIRLANQHQYKLVKILGTGAYAIVFEAVKKNTRCALKFINNVKANMESVQQEIDISFYLRHRFILESYEQIHGTNVTLLSHEFADYELFDYLDKDTERVTNHTKKMWMAEVAEGLDYMHRNGVAHLDIKLENMFLCSMQVGNAKKMVAKLHDFGLSQMTPKLAMYIEYRRNHPELSSSHIVEIVELKTHSEQSWQIDTFQGSPAYIAPEVLKKTKYDPTKADVFSLGVSYHVLAFWDYPWNIPHYDPNNVDAFCETYARTITNQRYKVGPDTWAKFETNFKGLMLGMLAADPVNRIASNEIPKHPYFKNDPVIEETLSQIPKTDPDDVLPVQFRPRKSRTPKSHASC